MLKNEHMSLFKGTFGLGNIFFLSKLFKDLSLHSRGSALVWGAPRLIQQIKEHGKFAPWLKGRLSEDSFRRSRMNSHVFFAKTFLQGRDHIYEIKIVKWMLSGLDASHAPRTCQICGQEGDGLNDSMGFEADVSKCCAILRFFKNCGVLDSMQGHFVLA